MFSIFNSISRRQFIKKSAIGILLAGGAFAAGKIVVSPPDMGLPDPYPELPDRELVIPPYDKKALFFNKHQYALVATLAAIIIPTDGDPGATEAGVVDYIDRLLAGSDEKQSVYQKGLKWIDEVSQKKYGAGEDFLNSSLKRQIDFLRLIQETDAVRERKVSSFIGRLNRKIDRIWDNSFGVGGIPRFFKVIRSDVCDGYFSNPISWKVVGYFGPPQPSGYMDFSDPPSSAKYTGSVRPVDNPSCLICNEDGRHPRGGLIDHSCTTCHRPHSPWPYDKNAFHLEDHAELLFPNPDRKRIN
jgi:gluconate 2-dehydrogenase gamma chain